MYIRKKMRQNVGKQQCKRKSIVELRIILNVGYELLYMIKKKLE